MDSARELAQLVDRPLELRGSLGERSRWNAPDLVRSLRPKILERELLTERQLDEMDRAARAHIEDPRTVMLPMLYFTAWGRKPG